MRRVLPSGDGKWRDPPEAFQVGRSAIPRGLDSQNGSNKALGVIGFDEGYAALLLKKRTKLCAFVRPPMVFMVSFLQMEVIGPTGRNRPCRLDSTSPGAR